MTLEECITIIEAREAIKELSSRYAWHVARGEIDAMLLLCIPDGHFTSPSADNFSIDQLGHFLREHLRSSATISMVHNHIIKVTGDKSTATCVMETGWSEHEPFCGYYADSSRRGSTGWRFVDRHWNYYRQPLTEG